VTPFSTTAYRDPFSNIDLRLTPSAGFGYDLVDSSALSWEIDAGPAFQYTRYTSVQADEPGEDSTFAVYTGTKVEWDITPDAELTFSYELTSPVPDTDEYNHHLSTVLSVDLFEMLDLDVTFTWDRVNKPPLDENGVAAKPDDLRLSVGLGWEF
jgi:putative salt-induced outer membrane protein YdiY